MSPSGSDSNSGTSSSSPWQTISHVNAQPYTSGAQILFQGGQTFSGSIALNASNSSGNLTIGSYGSGQAEISSGNSAACVTATDIPSFTVNNLDCVGGGNNSNTTAGISVVNDQSGNTTLAGPTITNNTVTGYGGNGIEVKGTSGRSGFSGVTIRANVVHDVTGNVAPGGIAGTACIYVFSTVGAGYSQRNVGISQNLVYNCTGLTSQSLWTGSGIVVAGTNGGTVSENVAHDFGTNSTSCGGAAGMWTVFSNAIIVRNNEAYNGSYSGGGCDGGGFDLDIGVTNSVLEYNYAHNNKSFGFLLCSCGSGTFSGNVVRYNVSEHNTGIGGSGEIELTFTDGRVSTTHVYNNIFYAESSGACITASGALPAALYNNLCQSASGKAVNAASGATSRLTLDNNDYYGAVSWVWGGTSYSSLASYQSASSQDARSVTTDPSVTDPGTGGTCYSSGTPSGPQPCPSAYVLQSGSAMINAGLDLTQSPYDQSVGIKDYYGKSIPRGGHYNIGADGGNP